MKKNYCNPQTDLLEVMSIISLMSPSQDIEKGKTPGTGMGGAPARMTLITK